MATKKPTTESRRERSAAMQAEQARHDRKAKMLTYGATGAAVLLVLGSTVGVVVYRDAHDPKKMSPRAFGVSAAAASCQPEFTDKVDGSGVHVGPGTNTPTVSHVDYSTVPPTSGMTTSAMTKPISPERSR